ncbi:MAG: hypothetical protein HOV81_21070 [Kofleriaceae bacterium]|nr:hypothetical protein [Kofleriaceae bacterium]
MKRALLAVMLLAGTASAEPAKVDWAKGLVTAKGVGIADRRAPNPAVARGTSRRGAEEAAKKLIAAKLGELPIAGGGKVADKKKDKDVAARLAHAVDEAITLAAEPETDGAWVVTMAVPLEAVRQAVIGPRALPADGDAGPAAVVVTGAAAKPAIGYKVGSVEVPTLFVTEVPGWAKDAPRAAAKSAKGGTLEIAGIDATPATLFVIVTGP